VITLAQDSAKCHLLMNRGRLTASSVFVNGTSSSALCLNSGAAIRATTVSVQGGALQNSGSTITGTLLTHQLAASDPLAGLATPASPSATCPGSACPGGTSFNSGHTYSLSPGTYTVPINVNSGATVCLAPGIYTLNATWALNAALHSYGSSGCPALPQGTTDPGVLLYFHQGSVQINTGGSMSGLSAARSGPYAGLLYWQAGTTAVALNGPTPFAGGAWYEPAGTLSLNAKVTMSASTVIVATLTFNANTTLAVAPAH
jgi:hypothetical protein